jgi:hypothetical protein
MSQKTEKQFDCISFKRLAQAGIYEQIKNLTPAQQVEFFRRQAESGPFAELLQRASHHGQDRQGRSD